MRLLSSAKLLVLQGQLAKGIHHEMACQALSLTKALRESMSLGIPLTSQEAL